MTKFLLDLGADVNATFDGKTPLESIVPWEANASGQPHLSVAKILLEYGANVNGRFPNKYLNGPIPIEVQQTNYGYPMIHVALHQKSFNCDVRNDWIFSFGIRQISTYGIQVVGSSWR